MSQSHHQHPRIVPFINWSEWNFVKTAFYQDNLADQNAVININSNSEKLRAALNLVNVWRWRGRVPHSADVTAQLLEVILKDERYCAELSETRLINSRIGGKEMELQSLYSFVIVRVVNGLVDPLQQGVSAGSVLLYAEKLGLPSWIAEIRHEATHQSLPSLSVLRAAAKYLIKW